jgi:HSP90 family molecular chaperone
MGQVSALSVGLISAFLVLSQIVLTTVAEEQTNSQAWDVDFVISYQAPNKQE